MTGLRRRPYDRVVIPRDRRENNEGLNRRQMGCSMMKEKERRCRRSVGRQSLRVRGTEHQPSADWSPVIRGRIHISSGLVSRYPGTSSRATEGSRWLRSSAVCGKGACGMPGNTTTTKELWALLCIARIHLAQKEAQPAGRQLGGKPVAAQVADSHLVGRFCCCSGVVSYSVCKHQGNGINVPRSG